LLEDDEDTTAQKYILGEEEEEVFDFSDTFSSERQRFTFWSNDRYVSNVNQVIHGFKRRAKSGDFYPTTTCSGYDGVPRPFSIKLSLFTARLSSPGNNGFERIIDFDYRCALCHYVCRTKGMFGNNSVECSNQECSQAVFTWGLLKHRPAYCGLHTSK